MEIHRNRTILVIGIKRQYKQMGKPYFLRGIYSPNYNRYVTGLDVLEDKAEVDRFSKKFSIDPQNTMFTIKDNERLDLSNDEHFIKYLYCLINPHIARSRKDVIESVHLLYLHDAIAEAENSNKVYNNIFNAVSYVAGLSELEVSNMAMYMGINTREQSPSVIRSNINKIALEEPEKIMKYKELPNLERHVFVSKLMIYDIIVNKNNGLYFRDQYLAANKSELIDVVFKEDNRGLLTRLTNAVEVVENPASKTSRTIIKTIADETSKDEIQKLDSELSLMRLQMDYLELTGSRYTGDMNHAVLKSAIDDYSDKLKKVNDFKEKYLECDIAALKKSASARKMPEEIWMNIEDIDTLKSLIIDFIMK